MSAFIMLQNAPVARPQPNGRRRRGSKQSTQSSNETTTSKFFGLKNSPRRSDHDKPPQKAPSVGPGSKSRQSSMADYSFHSRGSIGPSISMSTNASKMGFGDVGSKKSGSVKNAATGGSSKTFPSGGPIAWSHAYVDEPADDPRTMEAYTISDNSRGSIAHSVTGSGQTSTWLTYMSSLGEGTPFSNQNTTITAHKKVYNADTSQYMEYHDTLDLFERKLYEFNQKSLIVQESLTVPWVYVTANEHFYTRTVADGVRLQERVLSRQHLQILRYNYFVQFQPNTHYVEYCLETQQYSFMKNVPKERKYRHLVQEYKQSLSQKKSHKPPPTPTPDQTISVERGLALMKWRLQANDPSQSHTALKSHISQTGFWWDVYQDIRRESSMNQFSDYLPSDDVTRTFYIELLDFFLQRFRMLGCEISDSDRDVLTLDELHELNKNFFCYLDAADHAQIIHLQSYLELHFFQQARVYVPYATTELMREVLVVVTACVCDNLRMQCYGMECSDEIFVLLEEFIMVCIDIVLAEWKDSITYQQALQQASSSSVFDTPMINNESPPSGISSPSTSPIDEKKKNPEKKLSFFRRFKMSSKK